MPSPRGPATDHHGPGVPPVTGASLTRFAGLAAAAAVVVIGLKVTAWLLTGSVGLLADAVESLANLAGALVAWVMLWWAAQPPDDEHAFGHTKAEYFSSGFEGALILVAGIGVIATALPRLLSPQPVEAVAAGLAVAGVATVLNGGVAWILLQAGRRHGSITLEAGGHHLLTDIWTSVGVILGVGLVALTGWNRMDAVLALAVALFILLTGWRLVRRSALGLLDTALPEESRLRIEAILDDFRSQGLQFHAIRTRRAGQRSFVSMHVLVPGQWSVQRGHDLAEDIEARIRGQLPGSHVFTHLEPIEDPISFQDTRIAPLPNTDPSP
jgi:cation diffusion facilitator family transporter